MTSFTNAIEKAESYHAVVIAFRDHNFPTLNSATTSLSVATSTMPSETTYSTLIAENLQPKEKDSVISSYIADQYSRLAPYYELFWLQSRKWYDFCVSFFTADTHAKALADNLNKFQAPDSDCTYKTTAACLQEYREMCRSFRDNARVSKVTFPALKTQTGNVLKELIVPISMAARVKTLVEDMRRIQKEAGTKVSEGANHAPACLSFLEDPGFETLPGWYNKRKANASASMKAYMIADTEVFSSNFEEKVIDAPDTVGVYLMTTAICNLVSSDAITLEGARTALRTFLDNVKESALEHNDSLSRHRNVFVVVYCVLKELNHLDDWNSGDGESGGVPGSQQANIDLPVSGAFWLFKIAQVRSYREYLELLCILHNLSGKTNLIKLLKARTERPCQLLGETMSECIKIHLPPFVLNTRRLQDLVGTYCAAVYRHKQAIECPVASTRYSLHMGFNKDHTLKSILFLYDLERSRRRGANRDEKEIYQAHHCFHQSLLQKDSIYSNVHQVKGNALHIRVTSVAS